MRIRSVPIKKSQGHILIHNVADASGRKVLKKGTMLDEAGIEQLRALGRDRIDVGILDEEDVHEDRAARAIAAAILASAPALQESRAVGGRVNFHVESNGVLYIDEERLRTLNRLPGVTLATRPQHATLGPAFETTQAATLKIIPYAVPQETVAAAVAAAGSVMRIAPLPPSRLALLITADEGSSERIRRQFEEPTRARLERLGSRLEHVEVVPAEAGAISEAARRLVATHDGLIVGGQTSIMDIDDITPRALADAGAEVALHGAPVEPGNLLALAYHGPRWILCAPGCAKSPTRNVVDFVLPRLIAGERLDRDAIAALAVGGLL